MGAEEVTGSGRVTTAGGATSDGEAPLMVDDHTPGPSRDLERVIREELDPTIERLLGEQPEQRPEPWSELFTTDGPTATGPTRAAPADGVGNDGGLARLAELSELLVEAKRHLDAFREERARPRPRHDLRCTVPLTPTAPSRAPAHAEPRAWTSRPGVLVRGVTALAAAGLVAAVLFVAWPESEAEEAAAGDQSAAVDRAPGGIAESEPASVATLVPADQALATLVAQEHVSVVAHATVPQVEIRESPEPDAPVTHTLANPTENGGPLVFLVDEVGDDGWVKVDLPVRPNGTQGWIPSDVARFTTHAYRIEVSVGEREFRLFRNGERIMHSPVAVGATDTPTPGGTFYIKELLKPPNPNTVYGPFAFGLSGFSNALESFAGGQGVIGIHGTDDPDAIGNEVSHGCIRLSNDQITELVGLLPLGTPVDIVV